MNAHKAYITITAAAFIAMAVVLDTFPRSTVSVLEKRELATFPEFTAEKLRSGAFAREVSAWFSDSEPFRDDFMALSMRIKHGLAVSTGDDNVTFHASTDQQKPSRQEAEEAAPDIDDTPYENKITADENAKIANAGIIVVGKGQNVRALMAYGGSAHGCTGYAQAANKYKEAFGDKVNVYCMVIPTAVEFYCPDKARSCTNPQRPTIDNVYRSLSPGVKPVDAYAELAHHVAEPIYLRTDHHWAPLGAYYAAKRFAHVAGVPFMDLKHYDRHVVHGYVGSMYGYSRDIAIKNAPEDFVYYTPKGVTYTTTYTNYSIDKDYRVTGEGKPFNGKFFAHFKDGSGAAYCTFMGGDTKITKVHTSTKNHRRVLILKDSFGNAIPGYLFFSFEEVHVVDSRYFTKNMRSYVENNKITDILFANNIFKAYSKHTYGAYMRFLTQADHTPHEAPSAARVADIRHKTDSAARATQAHTAKEKDLAEPTKNEPTHEEKPAATETPQDTNTDTNDGNETQKAS